MLDFVLDFVVASPWTYLAILAVVALDALLPIVPSETVVITAGVAAAGDDLTLPLVVTAAALGAMMGDNTSFLLGRTAGERVRRQLFAGEKAATRLRWARQQLHQRGGTLILVSRFVPGGRTATTLASGLLRMKWSRFLRFDAAAGLLWASFATLLGYAGGATFEDDPTLALVFALAVAATIGALVELGRRCRHKRVGPATG